MTTPDTTTDEQLEELLDAVCNTRVYDDWAAMREAAAPILAEIRRHAAADALRRKAKSFDNSARMFLEMSRRADGKGDNMSATIFASHATQASTDANCLRLEADGIIAEGYEYECQECDTPVPDAGDLCEQHDVDDEDRWAE